jgi:glyoxylase-like metal-dependent hydrolase (beta-lactamase superfamily II)
LSHTLIYGRRTSLLVDPPITQSQTTALADWIDAKDRTLDYIYITHWHGDHWLGTRQLLDHYPHAVVLASTGTLSRIYDRTTDGGPPPVWIARFPNQLPREPAPITGGPMPTEGLDDDGFKRVMAEKDAVLYRFTITKFCGGTVDSSR